jgi:hypothetical protein
MCNYGEPDSQPLGLLSEPDMTPLTKVKLNEKSVIFHLAQRHEHDREIFLHTFVNSFILPRVLELGELNLKDDLLTCSVTRHVEQNESVVEQESFEDMTQIQISYRPYEPYNVGYPASNEIEASQQYPSTTKSSGLDLTDIVHSNVFPCETRLFLTSKQVV